MSEFAIVYIFSALILCAFIKGSLGLGFSTLCVAMLVHVVDLKTAISIVLFPSLLSNLIVMFDAGMVRLSLRLFWSMLLMALPGMLIGLQLLRQEDTSLSILILSGVLMVYGVWGYRNRQFRINDRWRPTLNPAVGLSTGMINGATGSQIFPIMPYLLSLPISKQVLVQTINMSFTLCSLIMLVALNRFGTLDLASSAVFSLGVVPVAVGVWLGNRLRKRMSDDVYRRAAMLLMIALGVLLQVRTLFAV